MFKKLTVSLNSAIPANLVKQVVYKIRQEPGVHQVVVDPIYRSSITLTIASSMDEVKTTTLVESLASNYKTTKHHLTDSTQGIFYKADLSCLCTLCNPRNNSNVASELIEKKWLFPLDGPDVGYSESMTRLIEAFDRSFVNFCLPVIGPVTNLRFSSLLSRRYAERIRIYGPNSPHLFVATHLTDHDSSSSCKPRFVLQSAPCFKVYAYLENQNLQRQKVFCLRGESFRNESKSVYLMERLYSFSMREFVFVGTPEFVLKMRDTLLELSINWSRELGLQAFGAEATDPFFISEHTNNGFNIPKYVKQEVRSFIPYRNDSISIGSFDTHGDLFSKTFAFCLESGEQTWTGCFGLGLERAVWSFLQQYGLEEKHWPVFIRSELSKLS